MSTLELNQIGVQELKKDDLIKCNGGTIYYWIEMWGGVNFAALNADFWEQYEYPTYEA